jgi:hypothetical protein
VFSTREVIVEYVDKVEEGGVNGPGEWRNSNS